MTNDKIIRVGITQGDTNGIGYEVILKTLQSPQITELFTPVVYGSAKTASYHRKALELQPVPMNVIRSGADIKDGVNNLVDVSTEEVKVDLGMPSEHAGKAAFDALEQAVADLKQGYIDVLVTAPINKKSIQSEQFSFPGHTEYLEASIGDGDKALMILFSEKVRVALVTTHLPVSSISSAITKEAVYEKIVAFNDSLKRDFGVVRPRIAVLALNPHAGDGGLLGKEEQEVIIPAMEEAVNRKITAFGPYAADGFFGNEQYTHFDGVLAMYHDQGLAPFKVLAMENGVNFTAGLQYVRTSPDHGTGYDIAGKNEANEQSMRQAIYSAIDIFRNRERYAEMTQNPLRRMYFDKSGDKEVLDLTKVDDD